MSSSFDLIVIGGGPAGTAAAITAAREGCRVLLLERGRFPRHKVCGEFVSAESIELLKWLLGEAWQDVFRNAVELSQSRLLLDRRLVTVAVNPPAASIARYDLDFALWKAAKRAGVVALSNTEVNKIEEGQPCAVRSTSGDYSSCAVINASGRWSKLTETMGKARQMRWLGFKAHFLGDTNRSVDLYFFDGGYCGVQPVRTPEGEERVNVCALVRLETPANWEAIFARHPVLAERSRDWKPAFASLSTFPVTFQTPRPVSGHILNVGDAAGFVDPFVGDGISLALRSGHLAARSVLAFLRGRFDLKSALEDYQRRYRKHLLPVYDTSSLLRGLLRLPRVVRAPMLFACERAPRITQYLMAATRPRAAGVNWQGS